MTEFLEINFDEGVRSGQWVFLFDSFDEVPDVLSSTEADQTVLAYSNAISDFFSGLNACRGVIASREYRGPARQGWRVFRVLELSEVRQNRLDNWVYNQAELPQDLLKNINKSRYDLLRETAIYGGGILVLPYPPRGPPPPPHEFPAIGPVTTKLVFVG